MDKHVKAWLRRFKRTHNRGVRLEVGDKVRSSYRAPWVGIVEEVIDREQGDYLCRVRCIADRHGRAPSKATVTSVRRRVLHAYWLTKIE